MKIDISPKDMWYLRDAIHHAVWLAENLPTRGNISPHNMRKANVFRKFNRKLNLAIKRAYGYDCSGSLYYH